MRIFDITIKNFRGIESAEKIKCGVVNTIVGRNDSGKSALLKALSTFFNEKLKPEDIFQGKRIDDQTEILVRFDTNSNLNELALDADGKLAISKCFHFDKNGKLRVDIYYICNDLDHPRINNCWGVKEDDLNEYLEGLGERFTRSGRGVTNLSKIERILKVTDGYGRVERRYKADEFLKNISKHYRDIELPIFSIFEAEQNLNIGATDFQSQFKQLTVTSLEKNKELTSKIEEEVTSDLTTEFDVITLFMQKNVPEIDKIEPRVNCNWGNLVKFDLDLKFKNEHYSVPISNKGSGFKRLLMVAYFEYLATRQSAQHQIFAIEEPETYLHPSLQEDLLASILTISQNSQFFITTHSPIFAGATKKSNIIVVQKNDAISNYLNIEKEDDLLNLVISELGIRPNYNLLNDNIKKVVFVEGSGDVKFWQCAISKIKGVIPNDIMFLPCGGNQVDFFVNANLCKRINRNFMVVLDTDKGAIDHASKAARQQELKKQVENLGGKFKFLLKREIENYYHRDAIQRVLGVSYTLSEEFTIQDYTDIKNDLELEIPNHVRSALKFKSKNNQAIFNEMTSEEWLTCGYLESNDKTDIENIIEEIMT